MSNFVHSTHLIIVAPSALGIGAASFLRRKLETEAEAKARKDIAESPTALPERPEKDYKTTRPQDNKLLE